MSAKKKLSLTVDEKVIKGAKHKAIEEGTSISAEVERHLRQWASKELSSQDK